MGALFKVSPTRLAAFAECPRRYHLTYLHTPKPPSPAPHAHQALGDSVHLALARWWDQPPHRRNFGHAGNLLNETWINSGYRDQAQSDRWRGRARGWVRAYCTRQAMLTGPQPIGIERTVSARHGDLILEGRVDRLDDRDGQLVVVDYKVTRDQPTDTDARTSTALAMYAVAAGRMLKRRCAHVELHHLPTGTVAAADHDAESAGRHLARVVDLAEDIQAATDTLAAGADVDEVFPARPGPLCPSCDHRDRCAEGQAAGPAIEPWAALDRWDRQLQHAGQVA